MLLFCVLAAAAEPIRVSIADAIPGGDPAVREFALALNRANPGLELSIQRLPVAEAVAALKEGRVDLLLVQQPETSLVPAEFPGSPYAAAAAVLLVHRSNPVKTLSVEQLRNIYRGAEQSWEPFTQSPFQIHRYLEAADTPGEAVFRRRVMGEVPYTESVFRLGSAPECVTLTGNNPNAISVSALADTAGHQVKPLAIDGVLPLRDHIAAGSYPLTEFRFRYRQSDAAEAVLAVDRALDSGAFLPFLTRHELVAPLREEKSHE